MLVMKAILLSALSQDTADQPCLRLWLPLVLDNSDAQRGIANKAMATVVDLKCTTKGCLNGIMMEVTVNACAAAGI